MIYPKNTSILDIVMMVLVIAIMLIEHKFGKTKYGSMIGLLINAVKPKQKDENKMGIENKSLPVAKELDDAMMLMVELVKDIKSGKDAAAIASENLPVLMGAISGADAIPQEIKDNKEVALATVGYRLGDLAGALIS